MDAAYRRGRPAGPASAASPAGLAPIAGRGRWSGTAAPRRHVSPAALPMSAVSARGPDGAHAIG